MTTNQSNNLRPCPFCGGTKICTEKSINLNYCDNCSAESNIEHWNTRPIEDNLRNRIAELEALVERLIEISDCATVGMVISNSYSSPSGIQKLAKDRRSEWETLVKDWKEREE